MANLDAMEVKRGMVFYMDVPSKEQPLPLPKESCVTKKRPYIVLSTDEMNATSELIHVAPITTKPPYDHQWYRVPFKSRDQTYRWINISYVMLVPKKYCTIADYSESISQMTFENSELMKRIDECLAKWFGITPTNTTTEETAATEIGTVTAQPFTPNFNITINIPGFTPIQTTVNTATAGQNVTVEEKAEHFVDEPVVDEMEEIAPDVPKVKLSRGRSRTSDEIKTEVIKFIKKHSKKFGGDMKDEEIAATLGISVTTVSRYKAKIENPNWKRKPYHKTSETKNTVAKKLKELGIEDVFMEYYEKFGAKAAYIRFKYTLGFNTIKACYNAYHARKQRNKKKQKAKA